MLEILENEKICTNYSRNRVRTVFFGQFRLSVDVETAVTICEIEPQDTADFYSDIYYCVNFRHGVVASNTCTKKEYTYCIS